MACPARHTLWERCDIHSCVHPERDMEIGGYTRLRRRLMLAMLAFSLVPLLSLGLFFQQQFTGTYNEKLVSGLEAVTESKRRALDTFLEERVSQIKSLVYTHSFEELSDETRLGEIFSVIQSNARSYVDMGIILANGRHAAYVGPYNLEGANYADEPWFQEVMLKGQFVSDVFLGFRKYPHFIIAVARREGARTWIVRATIDSAAINQLLRRSYSGNNSDAFLLNTQGLLQSDSRNNGEIMSSSALTLPPRGKRGIIVEPAHSVDGRDMIAGMTWLERMPWLLVVMEDPREPLSPLERTNLLLVLFVVGGVAVICLGTFLTTRAIVGKLKDGDRKQAMLDAEFLQSSKMAALGKLAAGVAHEVNNPLMLIRENAGWMKDLLAEENPATMRNHKELSTAADKIEMHVDRAKGVTHRMLGLARRLEPLQDDVCVNLLTEQTIKFLETEALHRNITIVKELTPDLPSITTDATQIQQVLLNILDNAIDAVGRDGTITIRTGASADRSEVFVSVTDTGEGIPPELLTRIFDPFYTTKKVGEGTGLGLAICHSLLEKLGGHIHAVSAPGQGATFTVTLPLAANPALAADGMLNLR